MELWKMSWATQESAMFFPNAFTVANNKAIKKTKFWIVKLPGKQSPITH